MEVAQQDTRTTTPSKHTAKQSKMPYGSADEKTALTAETGGEPSRQAMTEFPRSLPEAKERLKSAWRRYLAELLGTLLFVYLGE